MVNAIRMKNKLNKIIVIQTAQLKLLLSASNSVLITSSALALILAFMQRELIAPTVMITWLSLVIIVALIRSVFIKAYKHTPFDNHRTNSAHLFRFRVGVLIAGLVWGSAGIVMFPANDLQHQLFLIFILAGLSAGSVISYSADIFSAIGYSVSVISPLLIRLLIAGDSYSLTMSMAVMLYLSFMIANSRHYYFNQYENIILNMQAIEREQAMNTRIEWHQAILAGSIDGYWLVDMQGQLLEVNETYSQMSGYSMQELLKMRVSDIEVMETEDETAAHIKKIMEIGEDRFETKHRRKDGTNFDVEISVQYRFIEGGQFVVFLQNVTERKQAEAKLKLAQIALNESLDRYRDLYEFAPIGYISINHEGVITEVNWKATSLFGLARKQLCNQNLDKFVIDDQKIFWINNFESMKHLADGEEISFELSLYHKDGSIFIATFNCLRTDDAHDQSMLSITLTDITKLKQVENLI
jgi:PAS domain S-box-containing protein